MSPEVTVLIPSYNPGRYLREAIASVYSQTYEYWKIVLVDDASNDDSLNSIADYLQDSRIKLIQNPVNLGQSKTQNIGLAEIDTPFIIMLDSDDWFFSDTLEVLVNEAQRVSEDVALICGNRTKVYVDENGNKWKGVKRIKGRSFDDRYEFILANYVPYPRFYRTSALKKVGGWPTDDPYEGRYLEDRQMDLRLIEHFKIHWVDHMLYNYRRHANNTSNNIDLMNEMIEWSIRNALKRWGNKFEPVFKKVNGWLQVERLVPITGLDENLK